MTLHDQIVAEIRQALADIRPVDPDEPMTKRQAAAYAKVSPKTIERWMKAGLEHFPGPRFTRRGINRFLSSMVVDSRSARQLRKVV